MFDQKKCFGSVRNAMCADMARMYCLLYGGNQENRGKTSEIRHMLRSTMSEMASLNADKKRRT